MKSTFARLAVAFLLIPVAFSTTMNTSLHEKVNPVARVITLLGDIKTKIQNEEIAEWNLYDNATKYCHKKLKAISWLLQVEGQHKGEDEALIDLEIAEIEIIFAYLEHLRSLLEAAEKEYNEEVAKRAADAANYAASQADLSETIELAEQAIKHLEDSKYTGLIQLKSAKTLTQALTAMVNASMITQAGQERLTAILQTANHDKDVEDDDESSPVQTPYQQEVYESKISNEGGVLDELNALVEKAKHDKREAQLVEAEAIEKHRLFLRQNGELQAELQEKIRVELKSKLDHVYEQEQLAADLKKTLEALKADLLSRKMSEKFCIAERDDFLEGSNARKAEMEALLAAEIEIAKASGAPAMATKLLQMNANAFFPWRREAAIMNKRPMDKKQYVRFLENMPDKDMPEAPAGVTFLQVKNGASSESSSDIQAEKLDFSLVQRIRKLGDKTKSQSLITLSMRMANMIRQAARAGSHEDPFKKIKDLIHNMINKLLDEQYADAKGDAFCEKEIAGSGGTLSEKLKELARLMAKLGKKLARQAQVKRQIAAIQEGLALLEGDYLAAMQRRKKQRLEFEQGMKDNQAGLDGIKAGKEILEEFYGNKDERASVVEQMPEAGIPESSPGSKLAPYKKLTACGGEYETIPTATGCKEAADALGIEYTNEANGQAIPIFHSNPKEMHDGCVYDETSGQLYYMDPAVSPTEVPASTVLEKQFDLCTSEGTKETDSEEEEVVKKEPSKHTQAADNIIQLLDVISQDIEAHMAQMKITEEERIKAFKELTTQYQKDKVTQNAELKMLLDEETRLYDEIFALTNEKNDLLKLIASTQTYLGEIKKRCASPTTTHQERIDKMKAELEGLQQALQIMRTETADPEYDMGIPGGGVPNPGAASLLQRDSTRRTLRGLARH